MAHAHDHRHARAHSTDRVFALGIVLNLAIVVLEAACGIVAHSMALLADVGHKLGDVLGLALEAGGAAFLARRRPTKHRTYGYRRLTLLSALANGIFLLVALGAIAWESVRRFAAPEPAAERPVIVVAAIRRRHQRLIRPPYPREVPNTM